ncbi:FMN-dependent NADH-azoreductase [Kiloniella antarctica]|uniref:FMN dependent NADH:quinone oxidoreductase n=1 Tax=Kiloniella antarctica TaxID=1550907 RepID=A0ABW5BDQ2_9PROT
MSKNLLVINSSPLSEGSKSRALTDTFAKEWRLKNTEVSIVERDLSKTELGHLDEPTIGAFYTPEDQLNDDQKKRVALSNTLVDELIKADTIIIGAPMHNFSIPSTLKSYIDLVARVGKTFSYTEKGPKGLLKGKKAYVLTATGGDYRDGSPASGMNFVDPYLRTVLGFLGISDVEFISAINSAKSDEGLSQAQELLKQTIAA